MATTPIHEQHFEDLSSETLTYLHLNASEAYITKDYAVISTLAVTDREVRSAMSNTYSKNILPIMGMVSIIEQLGEAYKRTDIPDYPDDNHSSFKKGLYYFNNQAPNDDVTKALYGLRNGVVHNASFYSVGRGNQPSYIFTYGYDKPDVVTHATSPWNGQFSNIEQDYFTTINPSKLLDVVQNCMNNVRQASESGKLEIVLPEGRNELIFRYFKWKKV